MLPPMSTGLYRAKQLALRGLRQETSLILKSFSDKVSNITSDQEQELQSDLEQYALLLKEEAISA